MEKIQETIEKQLEHIHWLWSKTKKKPIFDQQQVVKLTTEPRDLMKIFWRNPKKTRLQAILSGCEMALKTWNDYISGREIRYHDSVVGCRHKVDPNLPRDALDAISQQIGGKKVKNAE